MLKLAAQLEMRTAEKLFLAEERAPQLTQDLQERPYRAHSLPPRMSSQLCI